MHSLRNIKFCKNHSWVNLDDCTIGITKFGIFYNSIRLTNNHVTNLVKTHTNNRKSYVQSVCKGQIIATIACTNIEPEDPQDLFFLDSKKSIVIHSPLSGRLTWFNSKFFMGDFAKGNHLKNYPSTYAFEPIGRIVPHCEEQHNELLTLDQYQAYIRSVINVLLQSYPHENNKN